MVASGIRNKSIFYPVEDRGISYFITYRYKWLAIKWKNGDKVMSSLKSSREILLKIDLKYNVLPGGPGRPGKPGWPGGPEIPVPIQLKQVSPFSPIWNYNKNVTGRIIHKFFRYLLS